MTLWSRHPFVPSENPRECARCGRRPEVHKPPEPEPLAAWQGRLS